jgi:hypothetical protein
MHLKRVNRAGKKSSIVQARVLAMCARGRSGRRIGVELGIDRKTVSRILGSEAPIDSRAVEHEGGSVEAYRQITKIGDGFGYDCTNTDQDFRGLLYP